MLAFALAVPPAAGQGSSVLIDFGDGTYFWANVAVLPDNRTAILATELAAQGHSLSIEVTWFDSPSCLRSPCAFVDDIGNRNPVFPVYWHFYLWNATSRMWEEAPLGPSDTDLAFGTVIAWYLALDNVETGAPPRPVPTPDVPDVHTSFRGRLDNRGLAAGTIPSSARVAWDADLGIPEIATAPIVAYGNVYVATRGGLFALDADTGTEVWRNPNVRTLLSSPAVYDGRLLVGGSNGKLHVVDASSGREVWSVLLQPGAQFTGIASSPAIHEGLAYVGTFNETAGGMGRVVAMNLSYGIGEWTYETGSVHMSQPAILDGALYVGVMGAYDGVVDYGPPYGLLSLHLNGTLNWFSAASGPVASSPVVTPSHVYFTTKDGFLYALRNDGTTAWRRALPGPSTSSPSLFGSHLFVGSGNIDGSGAIQRYDLEGTARWTYATEGGVQASLVSDGELVCAATIHANGTILCVRVADGSVAWSYTPMPGQYILGSPVVVGGTLYAVSANGHVYAFREARLPPEAVPFPWTLVGVVVVPAIVAAVAVAWRVRRGKRRRAGDA